MCCARCPKAAHPSCLRIQAPTEDEWFCPNCISAVLVASQRKHTPEGVRCEVRYEASGVTEWVCSGMRHLV